MGHTWVAMTTIFNLDLCNLDVKYPIKIGLVVFFVIFLEEIGFFRIRYFDLCEFILKLTELWVLNLNIYKLH